MIDYLSKLISEASGKLITYEDYIRTVLYDSKLGYYMKDNQKIGRQGDFITSSNVSDIFGVMMAKWFARVTAETGLATVFCEVGAGNGRFAEAFLREWNHSVKRPLKYIIVESSPYHRKLQRELLKSDFAFQQVESLDELDPFEGMLFSNELFDALPVHVITKEQEKVYEIMVGIQNGQLFEEKVPLTNPEVLHFLEENQIILHDKQRFEVPLTSGSMLEDISRSLLKGLVITVDYGYTNEEWMEPARRDGSLRGYYHHEMINNVLLHPGKMDITSHVHFDWLIKKGNQLGLNYIDKLRQDQFLIKIGVLSELADNYDSNPFSTVSRRNRAIRSLIMPSGMSPYFHALIQQKGMTIDKQELFT